MKTSRMPRLETWAAPATEDPRAVSLGPNAEPATSSGIARERAQRAMPVLEADAERQRAGATVRCPHAAHAEANA